MAATIETIAFSQELSGATTTHTVTMPSGVVSGDLLVMFISVDGVPTITGPSGWTELWDTASGTSSRGAAYYKVSDGTEGADETFDTDFGEQSSHITIRVSGYSGTPEAGVLTSANSTAADPPSLTPSGGSDDYVYIAVVQWNDGTTTVSGYPTGYTENQTAYAATTSAGTGLAIAAKTTSGSSSDDPAAFTLSTAERNLANTLAISPSTASSIAALAWYHLRYNQ